MSVGGGWGREEQHLQESASAKIASTSATNGNKNLDVSEAYVVLVYRSEFFQRRLYTKNYFFCLCHFSLGDTLNLQ